MKLEELRVGNWVYALKSQPDPIQIGELFHIWKGRDYSPIPISKEWLEKIGFEKFQFKDQSERYRFKDNLYIDIVLYPTIRFEWRRTPICAIKYVHEVQNICFDLSIYEKSLD